MIEKQEKENKRSRALRVRSSFGKSRPRLSVFRSNRHIWAQIIDDERGVTLVAASSKVLGKSNVRRDVAWEVGKLLAQNAKKKKIARVVFDRGWARYHGQVRSLAEGAREGGLEF